MLAGFLHGAGLVLMVLHAAIVARERTGRRRVQVCAETLMIVAMIDTAGGRWLAPVYWLGLSLLVAMGLVLGSSRSPASGRGGRARVDGATAHASLGLIVMGVLLIAMPSASGGGHPHALHDHPATAWSVTGLAIIGAAAFAVASVAIAVGARRGRGRTGPALMAAAVGAMALPLVL
ncbi:hypothetical protein HWD99_00325 [Microbacterium sp. C5A9]|uniref:hypothetical protein n=1 Tax=Microbacterium sp. C5A9 TaxID=2736663 RepID=UPI001F51C740|nr:hypothetical protein [Microbacterium sp. C5A9]MCI1017063.1 hypothetical protein [Microbacterium sp. C5A9]